MENQQQINFGCQWASDEMVIINQQCLERIHKRRQHAANLECQKPETQMALECFAVLQSHSLTVNEASRVIRRLQEEINRQARL